MSWLNNAVFNAIFGICSAIVLFIYGIEHLSDEIERKISGQLKGIFSKIVKNKWVAAIISALTTALIQSSSATTVITIGLVEAGIITFSQSLGIIAGANVGTTITAQLVAFNLLMFGPVLIVIGFLLTLFGKRYSMLGKPIFYLGFLFFSLTLIGQQATFFKNDKMFEQMITTFNNPLIGVLIGLVATAVLQSSSVVVGMVVVLALKNVITLPQAFPIVLGANIGTTVTCLLAAARMRVFAKKTALAHLLFNVGGVVLFLPLLGIVEHYLMMLTPNTAEQVALGHAFFNITSAVIFLLLSDYVVIFIDKLVPSKHPEFVFETSYLKPHYDSKKEAESDLKKEIVDNIEACRTILNYSLRNTKTEELKKEIEHILEVIKFKDLKIKTFIIEQGKRFWSVEEMALLYKTTGTVRYVAVLCTDLASYVLSLKQRNRLNVEYYDIVVRVISLLNKVLDKLSAFVISNEDVHFSHEKKEAKDIIKTFYSSLVSKDQEEVVLTPVIGIGEDIISKIELLTSFRLKPRKKKK